MLKNERGQVIFFIALLAWPLIGMIGFGSHWIQNEMGKKDIIEHFKNKLGRERVIEYDDEILLKTSEVLECEQGCQEKCDELLSNVISKIPRILKEEPLYEVVLSDIGCSVDGDVYISK